MGQVRGTGMWAVMLGGRRVVLVLGGSTDVDVYMNLGTVVLAALVTLCLCQPKRRRGCGWLCLIWCES